MAELLRILLLIPLLAAVIAALLGPRRASAIRWLALTATLLCAAISIILAVQLPAKPAGGGLHSAAGTATFEPAFATQVDILPLGPGGIQFYIGLDGLNVWLVVLTTILMVSAVLGSWNSSQTQERANEYYAWLLTLQVGMIGVFLAFDIILFYVFFELTLVPLFFLIGIWGGPERRHAARKFFIYTLSGSVLALLGLIGIVLACYQYGNELTFAIPRLVEIVNDQLRIQDPGRLAIWQNIQAWVFLAMMAGFAIKVPLVPLHTWLPLAHVEAPTAGSVLLAGVLLKIGCYGFLRLCLPLAPDASVAIGVPLIGSLAVIGIIYGAMCALAQDDIKKLVAYSSVSHLGFCMLGMFALNAAGLSGSLLQMINHGLSTGGLFLLVGMLYDRYHTRRIADYGGMAARLPILSFFMVFMCLSSAGLPGLNGFVGEVMIFMGMVDFRPAYAVVGTAGIVLGAWYLLRLLKKVFFGPVKEPAHEGHACISDLNLREWLALTPIAVCCIVIGIYPQPLLKSIEHDIGIVAKITNSAVERSERKAARTPVTGQVAESEAGREKAR